MFMPCPGADGMAYWAARRKTWGGYAWPGVPRKLPASGEAAGGRSNRVRRRSNAVTVLYRARTARSSASILGGVLPPTSIAKVCGTAATSRVTVLTGP